MKFFLPGKQKAQEGPNHNITVLERTLQRQLGLSLHEEPQGKGKGTSCPRGGFISIKEINFLQ